MRRVLFTLLALGIAVIGVWYFAYRSGDAGTNPMCFANNTGSIVVTNRCKSAYDLGVDGVYMKQIQPRERVTLDIGAEVKHVLSAKQAENVIFIARRFRKEIRVARCSSYAWELVP